MKIENAIRRAFNRYGDRSTETRQHIPAPVKGLNTTDPISDMEKEYGTELVNMFPHDGRVSLRKGYAEYIDTGTGEPVHSLFTFRSGDTERAYACTGGKIIDISDPDAPVDKKTGQNSDVWHVAQAEILAVMVNGVDTPQQIDAAGDFSDATLTEKGAAKDSTFDNVNLYRILAYKGRMFFLEKNSARAWYTDAGTAVGELNKFNFNVVHSAGGNPIALGNITLDSGRGPDDLLAVFFDSGAVLLYSGTNPSDADSWGLVGQFNIGRLLGDRPLMQIGPDLVAMTADGIIPVLPFLQTGRARKDLEISRKISDLAREAIVENATNKGLGMIYYPGGSMVIFNIPDPGGSYQLVMNSQTMAWTVFEGMDALSWSLEGDDIYFGDRAGVVFKADTGRADNGGPIKASAQTAYSYFNTPNVKTFNMMRSLFRTRGKPIIRIGAAIDFQRDVSVLEPTVIPSGTRWGEKSWDTFNWTPAPVDQSRWQQFGETGTTLAMRMDYAGMGNDVSWFSSDVMFEQNEGI